MNFFNNSLILGRQRRLSILLFTFLIFLPLNHIIAQNWDFEKEKDNIKIYTRTENGKSLKSFKGVTDINAPIDKVFSLMEDVNNTSWWDKNISRNKVLVYEKGIRARYYLVYKSPWPIPDRDLCVDVKITTDSVTGERHMEAVSINGIIPEKDNTIRIKEYRQSWTIIPAGKNLTHIILEGYVDPAGIIPNWIYNMLIVDTPLRVINGLKAALEK
jgi:hypothetical protein